MKKILKTTGIIIGIGATVYLLSFTLSFGNGHPETGLSFSELYAKELGLDWRETYTTILADLKPRRLILMAYWPYLEPNQGQYEFSDLDWQINLAKQNGQSVVLVIGQRVPRWPECHIPGWAQKLNGADYNQALLTYLTAVVTHYQSNPAIIAWQVENEPYLATFGECLPLNRRLFDQEIALVKKIDPTRPVATTDSGELGIWFSAAKHADMLGTTLYRVAAAPYIGIFHYFFIPPAFYTLKAALVKRLAGIANVYITELQAEPWSVNGAPLAGESLSAQTADFTTSTLAGNFAFAKRTGLSPIYLWGAEWWYYRKIHGDPSFWDIGQQLLLQ